MAWDGGEWPDYVPVAERRQRAARAVAKLRRAGQQVAPVTVAGTRIASTFWGRAWCDNLQSYQDYETRLPSGRAYLRHGAVLDLQVAPGRVTALVQGSELYRVTVAVKPTPPPQWRAMCASCAGGIDSLVELLRGKFSKAVMERVCRQEGGLFPCPADLKFTCSCYDFASMCKHVAAAMYGVGARLDEQPELLFRLRGVAEGDLVAGIDTAPPLAGAAAAGRVLVADDIAALFGLDMASAPEAAPNPPAVKPSRAAAKAKPARRPAATPRAPTASAYARRA